MAADGASIEAHFVIRVTNSVDATELANLHHDPNPWTYSQVPAPGASAVVADYWVTVTQQELTNEVTAIGRIAGDRNGHLPMGAVEPGS